MEITTVELPICKRSKTISPGSVSVVILYFNVASQTKEKYVT